MPAIGFGMIWGGYTLLFWGYCQIKGYDISIAEIVVPKKWNGKWPPKLIDDGASSSAKVNPKDHPGDQGYNNDPNYGGEISNPSTTTTNGSGVFQA